jgi:hypothetical protein
VEETVPIRPGERKVREIIKTQPEWIEREEIDAFSEGIRQNVVHD